MPSRFSRLVVDLSACGLLAGLSLALFWPPHMVRPGLFYVGWGSDPEQSIWFLNWFPFAWAHHLALFRSRFIAWPSGMNLGWRTSVPALALLAFPLTLKYSALTSYNALMMLAPGLAGAGLYLAARELSGKTVPSLIAGLVFGFSSYEMGQSTGHLNLNFTVAVPLCLFACLRATKHGWHHAMLGLVLGILLAFEFGVSQEVCATFILFGLAALVLLFFARPALRPALRQLVPGVIIGFGVAALLSAPLLWSMLVGVGGRDTSIASPSQASGDFVSFFIPTPITYLGGAFFYPWTKHFAANGSEADGYLGLPLLLLLGYIYLSARADGGVRILLGFAALAALFSLGPFIHVAGYIISTGPWLPFSLLPIFRDMLPSRLMLYAWAAIALALSLWLAESGRRGRHYAAVLLAVAFCFPDISVVGHWSNLKIPSVFKADPAHLLKPGSKILILPYDANEIGDQYESGMKFQMIAQGYLGGGIAQPFSRWPLIMPLYNNAFTQIDPVELATFLAFYKAQRVLVIRNELSQPKSAETLLQNAGWTKAGSEDGVDSYQPPQVALLNLKARALVYERQAHLAVLERREQMNVCVLREIYGRTGLDFQFFYTRFFDLPLPPETVDCSGK